MEAKNRQDALIWWKTPGFVMVAVVTREHNSMEKMSQGLLIKLGVLHNMWEIPFDLNPQTELESFWVFTQLF